MAAIHFIAKILPTMCNSSVRPYDTSAKTLQTNGAKSERIRTQFIWTQLCVNRGLGFCLCRITGTDSEMKKKNNLKTQTEADLNI